MVTASVGAERKYSPLKDLRVEIDGSKRSFALCFWLYLPRSTPFPSTVLTQMHSEMATGVPFLLLDEKKKMVLLPLIFQHKETPITGCFTPWEKFPHASSETVVRVGAWVHIGCEIGTDRVRLHINGKVVGEELLSSSLGDCNTQGYRSVSLVGTDGDDDRFQRYVHGLEVSDKPHFTNHHHCVKDPPLQLSIAGSSGTEIEEDRDGVWCIVDGKGNDVYGCAKHLERRSQNHEVDNFLSDTESSEARYADFKRMSCSTSLVSDFALFKYGLGGLNERALFLQEMARAASDKELATFAEQASIFLGCSHHGKQILIAKRLVGDGTEVWNLISQNESPIFWENVVPVINQWFVKIARCSSRSLTHQDLELLRRIAGCEKLVARENFEKLWCWLYPVAHAVSRVWLNVLWNSASPKCIEGFITKEEAEYSLLGPNGLHDPGTFVLRFPTSRSWPHPDAGSLVVTYVGSDCTIHHKMLSLDFIVSSGGRPGTSTPVQDLLLAEPELSRFGRIIRTH